MGFSSSNPSICRLILNTINTQLDIYQDTPKLFRLIACYTLLLLTSLCEQLTYYYQLNLRTTYIQILSTHKSVNEKYKQNIFVARTINLIKRSWKTFPIIYRCCPAVEIFLFYFFSWRMSYRVSKFTYMHEKF